MGFRRKGLKGLEEGAHARVVMVALSPGDQPCEGMSSADPLEGDLTLVHVMSDEHTVLLRGGLEVRPIVRAFRERIHCA